MQCKSRQDEKTLCCFKDYLIRSTTAEKLAICFCVNLKRTTPWPLSGIVLLRDLGPVFLQWIKKVWPPGDDDWYHKGQFNGVNQSYVTSHKNLATRGLCLFDVC